MTAPQPAAGFDHPALAGEPSLKLRHVSDDWTVLLDADTAFWALYPRNGGEGESKLVEDGLPLFVQHKEFLGREIKNFREKIDLSAVYINATDRCNGNCPYCYIPREARLNGINMKPDELRSVLGKIERYHQDNCTDPDRQPVIVFHGSEPLLVKEMLFGVIEEFTNRMRFGIQTNATLLTEKDVAFLKQNRVSVGISIDSFTSERNSRTRVMEGDQDAYSAAVSALNWFDGYPGLSVITTVTKHNVADLAETIVFLHTLGVKAVLMNPVRCTAEGTEYLRPDNSELFSNFKAAVEMAMNRSVSTGKKIVISDFANIILGIVAPTARRLMCDITPCGGGRRFFTVMSDMKTAPCGEFIGLKPFHSVNMLTASVEDAMASPVFADIRARTVEEIEECKDCLYRNFCGAPCPAEVYAKTGDLNQPAPYCEFYKKIIDYAFELIGRGQEKNLLRDEMRQGMKTIYNIAQP